MKQSKHLTTGETQSSDQEIQDMYIGDYITSSTVITGTNRDQTSTTFSTAAGQFIPPTSIVLNPHSTTAKDVLLLAGMQQLNIKELKLIPPTPDQDGSVILNCTYTDIYGNGQKTFVGVIASWTLEHSST